MKLSLTKLQWDECCHKLVILCDEPDLQESYEINQFEADEVHHMFDDALLVRGRYEVDFDDKYIEVLIGELQNCIDIATDNIFSCGDNDWRGYMSSLGRVVTTLKAYRDKK